MTLTLTSRKETQMKRTILHVIAILAAIPAFAAGSGDHSHDHGHADDGHMQMMEAGKPGSADKVDRTIDVVMRETDSGGMIFEPGAFAITKGETIRFAVTNAGELGHEFVIDTVEGNARHKEMMMEMETGMTHDDPNSVQLEPGASGEVIWTFANAGSFEFACLIPGHYEAGMHGPIEVAQAGDAGSYTKGVVKRIKAGAGKVTIIHEELPELDMPAMTMVFLADDAIIARLSEGQEIEFRAERIEGRLTVTDLK